MRVLVSLLALLPLTIALKPLDVQLSDARATAEALFPTNPNARELYTYDPDRCEELMPGRTFDDEQGESGKAVSGMAAAGGKSVEFLSDLRAGSGAFYEKALNNLWWYYCETTYDDETDLARCVPEEEADKDWSGKNCLVASDTTCEAGFCESKDNCKWKKVVVGQPRERWYDEAEGTEATNYVEGTDQNSYGYSVGKYLGVAMFLAVLNVLAWFIFVCGRCVCCCFHRMCLCRCCSWNPREEGYNVCYQIRTPIFFYLFFLACIVGSAFVAYTGDSDIGDSLNNLFDHSREGLGEMQTFLGNAKAPMVAISGLVSDASTAASDVLQDNDYVRTDMDAVVASLNNWGTIYGDELNQAGASQDFDDAASGLSDNVDPIVVDIQNTLDTLSNELVDQEEALQSTIDDAVQQIVDLDDTVDGFYESIDDADQQVEDLKSIRQGGVLAIFALSIFCIFFGFLGVISYWTPCKWDDILIYLMNVTWFLGSIIVTLSWILGGITMFVSVVFNDSCHFLDIIVQDFEPYVGNQAATGLNACFNNTPLVIAFNLTKRVRFQEDIDKELDELAGTNIAAEIATVSTPLTDLNSEIKKLVSDIIMPEFSDFMNIKDSSKPEYTDQDITTGRSLQEICPFDLDFMTYANFEKMMTEPWALAEEAYTGSGNTVIGGVALSSWPGVDGNPIELNPAVQDASPLAWFNRVMTYQGTCGGTDCNGEMLGNLCTSGSDCNYYCDSVIAAFKTMYTESIPDAYDTQVKMMIDLGVEYEPTGSTACPTVLSWPTGRGYGSDNAGGAYDCTQPTIEMKAQGTDNTIQKGLTEYGDKLQATFTEVLDIASGAIGDIMEEVEKFLCNMKCGFIGGVYERVHKDLCTTLLGGVLQISAGFWFLALFMFLTSALGAILVVRMRGVSTEEAEEYEEGIEMKGVNLDLYN